MRQKPFILRVSFRTDVNHRLSNQGVIGQVWFVRVHDCGLQSGEKVVKVNKHIVVNLCIDGIIIEKGRTDPAQPS